MRREDRDSLRAELEEKVVYPWKVHPVGPGAGKESGMAWLGEFKENGVQLMNQHSDVIRLIGVVAEVKRADRMIRVFFQGAYRLSLGSGPYKGRGWQRKAVDAMLKAVVEVDRLRAIDCDQ